MSYATPAQYIAEVEAPDEASALKKAIEEFQITERWKQSRLVAQRRALSQHTTQRAFLLISFQL